MSASYPSAPKSFTTKTDGPSSTVFAAHVNDLQDEVVAIENGLITGLAHDLKFTDATFDIGKSGATRPRDLFISRNATIGGTATVTGGQVAFPATQVPSSDANTLDDYEEGTWTPIIGGTGGTSGQTYGGAAGWYTKIGDLVHAFFNVGLTNKGTITGAVMVGGLPFACSVSQGAMYINYFQALASNWMALGGIIDPGNTHAVLYGTQVAGVSSSSLATADISNTSTLIGQIIYRAA